MNKVIWLKYLFLAVPGLHRSNSYNWYKLFSFKINEIYKHDGKGSSLDEMHMFVFSFIIKNFNWKFIYYNDYHNYYIVMIILIINDCYSLDSDQWLLWQNEEDHKSVQHDHYYGLEPTVDVNIVRLQYSHIVLPAGHLLNVGVNWNMKTKIEPGQSQLKFLF